MLEVFALPYWLPQCWLYCAWFRSIRHCAKSVRRGIAIDPVDMGLRTQYSRGARRSSPSGRSRPQACSGQQRGFHCSKKLAMRSARRTGTPIATLPCPTWWRMAGNRMSARAVFAICPTGKAGLRTLASQGLPAGYIIQQMADYKNGLRKSSEPKMGPPGIMLGIGKSANDEEVKAAAEYFSSMKFKPWIGVVETETVPKTKVAGWMFVALEPDGKEPIGQRIIEMPEDLERTELRDSASRFIAYVPPGSIKERRGVGHHRRRRQDHPVLHLSRRGLEGPWGTCLRSQAGRRATLRANYTTFRAAIGTVRGRN